MRKKTFILWAIFTFSTSILFAQVNALTERIHYFYNSGWLVETSHHFLVFDFVPNKEAGISFAGLQKQLQSNPRKKPVIIFISHDHPDHFNDSIYQLQQNGTDVRFVLGWQPTSNSSVQNLAVLKQGDSLMEKNLSVYTHPATDEGSAFLVTTDGLSIYHAGDHALWAEELTHDYTTALQKIRTKTSGVDIAFLPAAKGMFTQCAVDSVMEKSVRLGISILQPKTVALQHIGCPDKLYRYGQVREKLSAMKVDWLIPERFNSRLY